MFLKYAARRRFFSTTTKLAPLWPLDKTRNIGIIAHIDAGKTTTTERMLFYAGFTRKIGDVDDGDTVMDFMQQEQERGITIQSAAITFAWNSHKINLIDTPGHADFTIEVQRSLRVLDGSVTILDAVQGVEAQTQIVCKQAASYKIPQVVFVNKMDREGADFGKSVYSLVQKNAGTGIVIPCQVPIFRSEVHDCPSGFHSVIDVVSMQHLTWDTVGQSDGKTIRAEPVDSSLHLSSTEKQNAVDARTFLVESLADIDDDFLSEYLSVEDPMKISMEAIEAALRRCTVSCKCTPVLCGSSFKNIGVQPVLDAVVKYLPSPNIVSPAMAQLGADSLTIKVTDKFMSALAFKVTHDPIRGPLVFVRVYSGTLQDRSSLLNVRTRTKERVGHLCQIYANDLEPVSRIDAGNIGIISGLKNTDTGDTLLDTFDLKKPLPILAPIRIPSPVFVRSVEPQSLSEEQNLMSALEKLQKEDPSIQVQVSRETGQTLISGMGELHLEIVMDRLLREFKVRCKVGPVWTSFRETLKPKIPLIDNTFLHRELVGGKPQQVEIGVIIRRRLEVTDEGQIDENIVKFSATIIEASSEDASCTSLPQNEIYRAVSEGIKLALSSGPLLHFPMTGLEVDVTDLKIDSHATTNAITFAAGRVVSNAFKQGTRGAVQESRDYLEDSTCTLLEPLMNVRVTVPSSMMGPVLTDLTSNRRAQILEMQSENTDQNQDSTVAQLSRLASLFSLSEHDATRNNTLTTNLQNIDALISVSSMVGYSAAIRSLTKGHGQFFMKLSGYGQLSTERCLSVLKDFRGI